MKCKYCNTKLDAELSRHTPMEDRSDPLVHTPKRCRDALKYHLKHLVEAATKMAKQHHDTCAFSLSTKYECSCGKDEIMLVIKEIGETEE